MFIQEKSGSTLSKIVGVLPKTNQRSTHQIFILWMDTSYSWPTKVSYAQYGQCLKTPSGVALFFKVGGLLAIFVYTNLQNWCFEDKSPMSQW